MSDKNQRKTIMKNPLPAVPDTKSILAAQAEQMILDKLPIDQKTLRLAQKLVTPTNIKRAAIVVAGGSVAVSIISSISRNRVYQAMVAKEMKKQLEPLRKKLDKLEAQNDLLVQQNEELKAELKKQTK